MKKIILTAAAVFAFGFANAQDKKAASFGYAKGDIVLGGNIKTNTTSENGGVSSKTSSSEIGPDLAYFISDKVALELGVTLGKDVAGVKGSTSNISVGARYYFWNLGERFKTYTNFGMNFGSDDHMGDGDKTSKLGFAAGIGMNYFLTSRVAINFGLVDVISYKSETRGSAKSSIMDINLNEFNNFFSKPTFGVAYKF
jgi:outer membrane protein